jgi:acyl carrier protein
VNHTEALAIVKESISAIVPDADFGQLSPGEKFRDALELDSLDFLNFVAAIGERTGCRIDEDDYPSLTTLSDCADFLASRTT